MNTQNINNSNNESINGMSQVVIDLRPEVKHHEGYGREKVADVYFRTQVRAYSRQVYGDYSQEAHEAAEKALTAFYSEVVELLKAEGWTLLNDYAHWHTCPELTKGDQYLYVHPDSISGEVTPADIDALEAKFKALTACEYRGTDNYGDIILTRSEADERMLYRETYAEGIAATIKECTTTKRSNLYKDRGDALGCIRNRIAIQNKRTDLTGHGTGYYRERKAVAGFVQEEYDRLLQAGYIKEATGQNGRTLCRWINKKEEKELAKAIREAEKAEKERKAQEWQEFLDREAEKQNSFAEGMRVKVPAASLERNRDKEAFVITRIRRKAADNGGNASLTVKSELTGVERDINGSDVSEILPALQEASEIKDVPAADLCWDEDEQGVKVWGNMEQHAENLTRMGAKRGRVVFKSNKTGLPTGADCWVLPKTKSEDVRQYVRKVHERIICDFSEAREKYGDKGHKYHEGEKVVTIYGRGTVVRGRAWYASDLIDVQLDTPTYNYIWSLVGTPQKMVAVSRNDIVSIELPEPPKEIIIDDATLQEASEIKPKATDRIESRKRTIIARAKEDKQAWRLVKGCEVSVRKAYTNDSSDPESWTYCVSWYADGQLVECENGVRLEQAAKALNDLPRWAETREAA